MIREISKITGIAIAESDEKVMSKLRRISQYVPGNLNVSLDDNRFIRAVHEARFAVEQEGDKISKNSTSTEIIYEDNRKKIKASPKGVRIKVAAENGVRYSFGPVWNDSIIKGKGIALVPGNREKLNHQAIMMGISDPQSLDISILASQVSDKLPEFLAFAS